MKFDNFDMIFQSQTFQNHISSGLKKYFVVSHKIKKKSQLPNVAGMEVVWDLSGLGNTRKFFKFPPDHFTNLTIWKK